MKNIYILLLLIINPCSINANILNKISNVITGSEIWNLDTTNIISESSPVDRLGESVSHGDYNNDGIQDLAIGIPNYDFQFLGTTINNIGVVLIIYGSSNGLSPFNEQLLFQTFATDPPNLENINGVEENDFFGKSLVSGDFNCDGITDLAVGTPEEDLNITSAGASRENVGAINIFYGSLDGFSDLGQGSTFFFQGTGATGGVLPDTEESDRFGWSLAADNFNGDGCDDLAASAPFEDLGIEGQITDAGQVEVYYGRTPSLSGHPNFRDSLNQLSDDLTETVAENNDRFGLSLAAGSFKSFNTFLASLAVGIPGEDVNGFTNAGAVQVFHSSVNGLAANNHSDIWSQAGNIVGLVEAHDRFGSSLAAGDFNDDFIDDLVIGVPREDINNSGISDAGSINIIYGNTFGLADIDNQSFHQNTPNMLGSAETSDRFGDVLTTGDLNDDGFDDVVIGVPREDNSRGAFHVLYGSAIGISTADNIYEQNLLGVGASNLDEMGFALTVANFGNGKELAVGIPGDNSSDGDNDSGSVEVFSVSPFDVIFADSFED